MIFTVNLVDWPECEVTPYHSVSSPLWKNTLTLLDLLRSNEVSASFFVQHSVAKRFPGLIKIIGLEQHEIACFIDNFTNNEDSKQAIRQTIESLEKLVGSKVIGTRCNNLSLTETNFNEYCYLLNEMGIKYDSSLPVQHPLGHYIQQNISLKAFANYKIDQHVLPTLLKLPAVHTRRTTSLSLSFGGTSFKYIPYEINHYLAKSLSKTSAVFTLPISELATENTHKNITRSSAHWYAQRTVPDKLQKIFSDYPFNNFIKQYYS